MGERAGVERRRREGKEGMTEGRGGRKAWGIRMGGIAPLLLGGIDAIALASTMCPFTVVLCSIRGQNLAVLGFMYKFTHGLLPAGFKDYLKLAKCQH